MHHSTYANCSQVLNLYLVLLEHVLAQVSVAVLQTEPDALHAVCPQPVYKLILPGMTTLGNRLVFRIYEHSLDTGRTKLDTENGLSFFNN